MLADRLRSSNGGGGNRPRLFVIIAIWAGFVLVENRGGTVARLKSPVAFVLCTCAGVSELLAHDEWRGYYFPSEKAFSASRGWGGITAAGEIAV